MALSIEERLSAVTWAWHEDETWGFKFVYPEGWYRFALRPEQAGVLYAPQAEHWATGFCVEARDIGVEVTKKDLPDLEAGFRAGLRALPECELAWLTYAQTESALILEAKCTFREGGQTRRRRTHLVYAGGRQFHVFVQGATPDDFEHWQPFLYLMLQSFAVAEDRPGAHPKRAQRDETIR